MKGWLTFSTADVFSIYAYIYIYIIIVISDDHNNWFIIIIITMIICIYSYIKNIIIIMIVYADWLSNMEIDGKILSKYVSGDFKLNMYIPSDYGEW